MSDAYAKFYNSENGDRVYDADSFSDLLKKFFRNGVFEGELQVISAGSMNITVKSGTAFIEGKTKDYGENTFVVPVANSSYPRIDTVVVEKNDTDRDFNLKYITGSYSSSTPSPTAPVRDEGIYQIVLAQIYVGAAVTSITQSNITDTRTNPDLCGYVAEAVDTVDFSQFTDQFEAYYAEFKSGNLSEFDTWFDHMKGQLTTDAAGNLQTEIDDINRKIHTNLLNPTLGTTTSNGVTCTNNGDGTYTVTGAVSSGNIANFVIEDDFELPLNTPLKLVGCPPGGGTGPTNIIYKLALFDHAAQHQVRYDYGSGSSAYTNDGTYNTFRMHLAVYAGAGTVNLTFKPMITTDTSATYDDFVQYSGNGELNQNVARINRDLSDIWKVIYPVGSIYMSVNSANPSTLFGGTWERIKDRFLLASGDTYSAGSTGGEATHTLTEAEMPQHYHTVDSHSHGLNNHTHYINSQTVSTTSNGGHNHFTMRNASSGNQPPFNTVYLQGTRGGDNNYILAGGSQEADSGYTSSIGGHTHSVTVGNVYTGGNGGNTTSASPNTNNKGSSSAHNNMPPYLAVYVWKRTA